MKNTEEKYSQADLDNYSNQLNDNNDAYWQARGFADKDDANG